MSFEGTRSVLIKDASGNTLNIPGGSLSATANVSGQPVNVSGSTVLINQNSGFNGVYITNQSGNLSLAVAPGNAFGDNQSFAAVNMTLASTELFGLDTVAGTWVRLRASASGSAASQGGVQARLLADVTQGGTTIRTRISGYLAVTDVSGGATLGSGVVVHGVKIRNISLLQGGTISGVVWIGGSGTNLAPFSGHGYPLFPGETLDLTQVNNLLQVRAVAALSGVFIACYGVDF